MRILSYLSFVFLAGFLTGCIPTGGASVTLSFWTDRAIAGADIHMLYANEKYIGDLPGMLESPICNDTSLINLDIIEAEDLHLTIRNKEGHSIDIGIVNLFSISTGIKIKPAATGKIFVDQSLDDQCTLVYLNWDE